jgi:hypothetical protein
MKINNIPDWQNYQPKEAGPNNRQAKTSDGVALPKDLVNLSNQGLKMSKENQDYNLVMSRLKVMPEVRPNLLSQVRNRVINNFYNSSAVAEKVAERALALSE